MYDRSIHCSPAKTVQTKFDAATLHSNHSLAAETQMVDDGSGKVEVRTRRGTYDLVIFFYPIHLTCQVLISFKT